MLFGIVCLPLVSPAQASETLAVLFGRPAPGSFSHLLLYDSPETFPKNTHTHPHTERARERNTQKHKVKFLCIMYLLVLKLTGESVSYCRRLKIFVNKFWGELRTEITVLDGGKKRRIYIYLVIVCAARPYVFAYMDIFLPA